MNCNNRDQNLLLLAHKELSLIPALSTLLHLAQCKRCREHYDRLLNTSLKLSSLPGASMVRQRGLRPASQPLLVGAGVAAVVLVLLAAGLVVGIAHVYFPHPAPVQDVLCTPGLPNGQCR